MEAEASNEYIPVGSDDGNILKLDVFRLNDLSSSF
jgi:hypothetical protein